MKIQTQIIDPTALTTAQRSHLVDELFELNRAIFEGVPPDVFETYLLGPEAVRTRIQVVRDADCVVGYTAIQVYACDLAQGSALVVRSLAGMLPAYRKRTLFGWFMAYEGLRLRLRHPSTPIYGFACPVHPSTYRMLARYAVDVWPQPDRATPRELERLMLQLAQRFGLQPEPAHPGTCEVRWTTIQGAGETASWAHSDHPASRFFVARNPRYVDGHGLLVLVPVRVSRILQASLKLVLKRIRKVSGSRPRTSTAGGLS